MRLPKKPTIAIVVLAMIGIPTWVSLTKPANVLFNGRATKIVTVVTSTVEPQHYWQDEQTMILSYATISGRRYTYRRYNLSQHTTVDFVKWTRQERLQFQPIWRLRVNTLFSSQHYIWLNNELKQGGRSVEGIPIPTMPLTPDTELVDFQEMLMLSLPIRLPGYVSLSLSLRYGRPYIAFCLTSRRHHKHG